MSFEGSVALVTGGGRGVGRAIALGPAEWWPIQMLQNCSASWQRMLLVRIT